MKLFFEEYAYPVDLLQQNLSGQIDLSYLKNDKAKIPYVGYFFNPQINDIVFILPKVFIADHKADNEKAFERYHPENIIDLTPENNPLKEKGDDAVVFELSAWLYQAINHFYERKEQSNIGEDVQIQSVKPISEKCSMTIIEITLSLINFHKKHKNLFTYISIVNASGNHKIHWQKTISKMQPVIQDDVPLYLSFRNKNKVINFDEELISLFYSVLNYLSQSYHFKMPKAPGYEIMHASKIANLIQSGKGTRLLKKIRHNYFTDELVELWNLLYVFFERAEQVGSGKASNEKLLVRNFNLVFEDMIDQLVSDREIPNGLKEQPDGKIVDHIYQDHSLLDEDKSIYFIGDSKYYKESTEVGTNSIYKQFTYAKNVIQYNINLFNNKSTEYKDFRYRDPLTEGYNITPNFFIRGFIDFENPASQEQNLKKDDNYEKHNQHFFNRLFDRDTLFLQSYDINFMYVVSAYVRNSNDIALKKSLHEMFRRDFISFIEKRFDFSALEPKTSSLQDAVEKNFKKLIGKIYKPEDSENLLVLALDNECMMENLQLLSQIEDDFNIYEYHLGTNVDEVANYKYLELKTLAAESQSNEDVITLVSKEETKYKKMSLQSVLFGIYKDEKHHEWILNKKKYNVRLGERTGAVKRNQQVNSARFLVLYNVNDESQFNIYRLTEKHYLWNGLKLKENGYEITEGGEENKYFIYNIDKETNELGKLDLPAILASKRQEFLDATKNEMEIGTPIYIYKNELDGLIERIK